MAYNEADVLAKIQGLEGSHLQIFIEEGWISPQQTEHGITFREIDVVRVQLILELQNDLSVNADAIPIILSLIDQVHGLRHKLRSLAGAVEAQPEDIQQAILATLHEDQV